MRHGLLHHLGGLQHEGQDQLARAELVADLLHRRQQHGVQRVDRRLMLGGKFAAVDDGVDVGFDAFLVAMQNATSAGAAQGSCRRSGLARLAPQPVGETFSKYSM